MIHPKSDILNALSKMDEYEFENLISDIWENRGWDAKTTSGSQDRGIDVIAEKEEPFGQKILFQAKRYNNNTKVGSPEIREYSSLRHQEKNVDFVVIITTSAFTDEAKQIANDLNVKLINGETLYSIALDTNEQLLKTYLSLEGAKTDRAKESYDPESVLETNPNLFKHIDNVIRGLVIGVDRRLISTASGESEMVEIKIWIESRGVFDVIFWNEKTVHTEFLKQGNELLVTDTQVDDSFDKYTVRDQSFVIIEPDIISKWIDNSQIKIQKPIPNSVDDISHTLVLSKLYEVNNLLELSAWGEVPNKNNLFKKEMKYILDEIEFRASQRKNNKKFKIIADVVSLDTEVRELNQDSMWEFDKAKVEIIRFHKEIERLETSLYKQDITGLDIKISEIKKKIDEKGELLNTMGNIKSEFGTREDFEKHLERECFENPNRDSLDCIGEVYEQFS